MQRFEQILLIVSREIDSGHQRDSLIEAEAEGWGLQPPIGATLMQTSSLLERLPPTEAGASTVQALIAELATAKSDSAVAGIITRTADLVHERSEHLARQRQQTAAILAAVTKRLEEMAG